MRWWQRIIITLVLAPLLWRLVSCYLASQQGETAHDLWLASAAVLGKVYLVYTLPALVVLLVILVVEIVLRRIGLDLMIVAVAPLVAVGLALGIAASGQGTSLPEGLVGLALAYGLVWGLGIREAHPSATRVLA